MPFKISFIDFIDFISPINLHRTISMIGIVFITWEHSSWFELSYWLWWLFFQDSSLFMIMSPQVNVKWTCKLKCEWKSTLQKKKAIGDISHLYKMINLNAHWKFRRKQIIGSLKIRRLPGPTYLEKTKIFLVSFLHSWGMVMDLTISSRIPCTRVYILREYYKERWLKILFRATALFTRV